jgi:hypothetical protein
MALKLDDLLPAIIAKSDSGLGIGTITKDFVGKSTAGHRAAVLQEKLASLVREGAIWGPFKHGRTQYYFAAGRGPSIETASQMIARLVSRSGVKLLSKSGLEKKVTGMNSRFFEDGIKHAVASQAVLELSCGIPKYYLHRDIAADRFGFENPIEPPRQPTTGPGLTLENLLPVYRHLKAEQGGFSAVKIFDLMQALNGSKEDPAALQSIRPHRLNFLPT